MNQEDISKFNIQLEEKRKEMMLGQEILLALSKEEFLKQYLDIGFINKIIKGMDGIPDDIIKFFYYGFLFDNKEAIITSDKKIIVNRQTKIKKEVVGINEIKEFFDYDGTIGHIAPVINKLRIKEWLLADNKIDKFKVFEKVLNKLNYYMDFGKDLNIVYTQACWIIATHCYPLFDWFPHILFNAPQESGKSKNGKLMMKLSFRGFNFGAVAGLSPPQFFRTLEDNRGTIYIDEYEKRDNSESQAIVNQMLNASASSDEFVIRLEQQDNKWMSKQFPIFCPKIICNISGINPTSLSRFIVYQLTKTLNKEKARRKPTRDEELYDIRDDISLLILENWEDIKKIYDNLELDFVGRDEDNWKPIYAIAQWINPDFTKFILEYIKTYTQIKVESHDILGEFFIALYDKVAEENTFYKPKEIAEWDVMMEILGHFKNPSIWIGKTLKSYKFEFNKGGGIRKYILSKISVGEVISRYFWMGDIIPIPPQTPLSPQSTHLFNNENKVLGVDCGVCVDCGGGGVVGISQSNADNYIFKHIDSTMLPCGFCGLDGDSWTHEVKGKVCCDFCIKAILSNPSILKEEAVN